MINYTDSIKNALAQLSIESLNDMQVETLSVAYNKNNVVLLSPTGTGKTLAYLLPLLNKLKSNNTITSLVIAPSRELALQIDTVFKSLKTGFKSCCCYGGHSFSDEKKYITSQQPSLIIGTPGRLLDHFYRGTFSPSTIEYLILDEFDKCIEFGFQEEMSDIISQLENLQSRVLLSATDSDEIPNFVGAEETVTINYLTDRNARIEIQTVQSPIKDKIETLYNLLCLLGSESTIVFCNYRDSVDRVYNALVDYKIQAEKFHGALEQKDRERALYKFSNQSSNILVSTDLAARGLDISAVQNVIHYHLPINEDAYTHRNGRTGRWDSTGKVFIILNESETLPDYVDEKTPELTLPEVPNKPAKPLWVTLYIGKGKKDKINRIDLAGLFYKKGRLQKDDLGKIDVKEHYSFVSVKRNKCNQLLKLIDGERIKGKKILIEPAK